MSTTTLKTNTQDAYGGGSVLLKPWPKPAPSSAEVEYARIETIDLALWDAPSGKEELAKTMRTALHRDGFFYVVNHAFDQSEVDRIFSIGQVPFDQVPDEEKRRYEADIKKAGSFKGYKLQSYWEIENGVRDRIEHYNLYNDRGRVGGPEAHPTALRPFLDEIEAFLKRSRREILRKVLALISICLVLPEDYLWRLHQYEDGREGPDLFRFMVYDPLLREEAEKTDGVYLKGHTDFNTLSILFSQPITSLQILMPDGTWRYVRHRDNALVCNIGDQLSFLTGGYLRATIHRVVRPPPDQVHLRRLGVFHFAHAVEDVPLKMLTDSPVVAKEGRNPFPDRVPTSGEWEKARVSSYGTTGLVKGDLWDEETIAGVTVRHYR